MIIYGIYSMVQYNDNNNNDDGNNNCYYHDDMIMITIIVVVVIIIVTTSIIMLYIYNYIYNYIYMFSCRGVARPWTCARRRAWAGASSAVRSAGTSTAKVAKKMAKDGKFSQADAANGFKKFRRKGANQLFKWTCRLHFPFLKLKIQQVPKLFQIGTCWR